MGQAVGQTADFNTWGYLQTWPKLMLQSESSCVGSLVKRHGAAGSRADSVSSSSSCRTPTAWQCWGWQWGREGHQLIMQQGQELLAWEQVDPFLQDTNTYAEEFFRKSGETKTFGEPMMSRDVTWWPCLLSSCESQGLYQIPDVQNSSFTLLHISASHGRTVVMLCLVSGGSAFTSEGLCDFFFL